jgi:hypothetical protein
LVKPPDTVKVVVLIVVAFIGSLKVAEMRLFVATTPGERTELAGDFEVTVGGNTHIAYRVTLVEPIWRVAAGA